MYLTDKVKSLLYEAQVITTQHKALKLLGDTIRDMQLRIDSPLKVAVVGIIKAGKSTLINALLRKEILATGNLEATYSVTWFKYGEVPRLVIRLKDNSCFEAPIRDLHFWTLRDSKKSNPRLDNVQYVEIYDNNPMLQQIEIIDTPGLGSTYRIDSENAIDFLGISSQITTNEASKADAIIYAFSKGVGESDNDVLSAFQNSFTSSSPINAFGVLTRVDANWKNIGDQDPFEAASRIAYRYKTNPYFRTKLYNVVPVSSKTSGCTLEVTAKEYEILLKLSELPEERLGKLLVNAERFCFKEYDDISVCAADRRIVFDKYDRYGIYSAVGFIRGNTGRDELAEKLYRQSHVGDIGALLDQHFAKRASTIKAYFIISKMKDICQTIINKGEAADGVSHDLAQYILARFQEIEENEQGFLELKVLQYYYNSEIKFFSQQEEEDFLRLMGEYGSPLEERLNCKGGSVYDMIAAAREKSSYWYTQANLKASRGVYPEVSKILGRTCEHIYYYLKNAQA